MDEPFQILSETEQGRQKIRDIKVMILQGPRSYTLVKVIAEDGLYGIGEAYGSPGVGMKEQIEAIKPALDWTGSAGDRCALHPDGSKPESRNRLGGRQSYGWLGPCPDAGRQRNRDGAVGLGGENSGRFVDRAAGRAVSRQGSGL